MRMLGNSTVHSSYFGRYER